MQKDVLATLVSLQPILPQMAQITVKILSILRAMGVPVAPAEVWLSKTLQLITTAAQLPASESLPNAMMFNQLCHIRKGNQRMNLSCARPLGVRNQHPNYPRREAPPANNYLAPHHIGNRNTDSNARQPSRTLSPPLRPVKRERDVHDDGLSPIQFWAAE
ncbi:hypothetical protein DFH09DRAFT_1076886 [Mycena vulgaris]|nr:hypothetical protein DFH09DRAFT_1076886 [Mycena vulgaris]